MYNGSTAAPALLRNSLSDDLNDSLITTYYTYYVKHTTCRTATKNAERRISDKDKTTLSYQTYIHHF